MQQDIGVDTSLIVPKDQNKDEETYEYRAQKTRSSSPRLLQVVLIGVDNVLFVLALVITLLIYPYFHLIATSSTRTIGGWDVQLIWIYLSFFLWCISARLAQAQELTSAVSRLKSITSVLFALLLTAFLWMIFASPFIRSGNISFAILLPSFLLVASLLLGIWRIVFAEIIILPRFRSRAVILGANVAGTLLAKELQQVARSRTMLLGYIDEGSGERQEGDNVPLLGGKDVLRHLVESGAIDSIITAINHDLHPDLFHSAIEAAQQGIAITPMTVVYERVCGKIPVEHIGDQWYALLPSETTTSPLYACWHKTMDIAFGLLGIIALLFLLPLLALLIFLDSPGPIFYHQERLGYKGKKFYIHKFRSMYPNAEQMGQAMWAKGGDARVTRIGHFLRATHLDELPQVFNIWGGEMSLIGPRPERKEFVAELEKTIPYYRYRLLVKPGITGWAQVKHSYTNTNEDALVKSQYDLFYIRHQSLMLDVSILLRTVTEVLFRRGI